MCGCLNVSKKNARGNDRVNRSKSLVLASFMEKEEKRKSTTVKCGKQVRLLDNQAFGNWIWNTDAGGVGHWQM